MGAVIYPQTIIANMNNSNAQLENLRRAVDSGNRALEGIILETELQGKAWGNIKSYFQDIQIPILQTYSYWIEAQKEANDKYMAAASELPQGVLCEDTLTQEKITWERERNRLEYQDKLLTLMPGYYRSQIERCNLLIIALNDKLTKIQMFKSKTNGIYDHARALKDTLAGVDANLGKVVRNSLTNVYDYSGVDEKWTNSMAREWLYHQDITEVQICNMEAKGYSAIRLKNIVITLETPEDLEFFKCLMTGTEASYIEAFDINPNDLSDIMTVYLADYANCLIVLDESGNCTDLKQYEMFNNAILGSEKIADYLQGTRYRDVYLEKLYVGFEQLIASEAMLLSVMDPNSKEYQKREKEYNKKLAMTNIWATESILFSEDKEVFKMNARVSGLTYMNGVIDGTVMYDGLFTGGGTPFGFKDERTIQLSNILNGEDLSKEKQVESLRKLIKAKEDFEEKMVQNILVDTSFIALSLAAPEYALLLSLTKAFIARGDISSIAGNITIPGVSLQAQSLIVLKENYDQYLKFSKELKGAQQDLKNGWFGAGGKFTIGDGKVSKEQIGVSFGGMFSPDGFRNMLKWEQGGIKCFIDVEAGRIDLIRKNLNDDINALYLEEQKQLAKGIDDSNLEKQQQLLKDALKLLDGGYDIAGETDYSRFEKVVTELDTTATRAGVNDFKVLNIWRDENK